MRILPGTAVPVGERSPTRRRVTRWLPIVGSVLAALAPVAAVAQRACESVVSPELAAAAWPAPLDRAVSLRLRDAALRVALDRLAAAAGVRLSYSGESLPLDRTVCLSHDRVPLGAALAGLLGGTGVRAVVAGVDQVVLTPSRGQPSARVAMLDQVVITGSAAGAPGRELPVALNVVERAVLGERAVVPLSQAIDGTVPGMWAWSQSPTSLIARYGGIRGASSFGVSAPKIYVDGIETANPLLVSQLAPESIQQIEVMRGPQGAALYGADAISGVVNIVTRQDGAAGGTRELSVRSGLGGVGSDYAARPVLTQDHGAALRLGSGERSVGLVLTASTLGAVVPDAYAQRFAADLSARRVLRTTHVSGTARMSVARASAPVDPALAATLQSRADSGPQRLPIALQPAQRVVQYTVGGTATRVTSERWTHTVTAGIDGYSLAGVAVDPTPVPSAVDSALRASRGQATRATLRASSVARVGLGTRASARVTLTADYGLLRDRTAADAGGIAPGRGARPGDASAATTYLGTGGLAAQATTSVSDALFITTGLRGEWNQGFTPSSRFELLPVAGVAWVGDYGAGSVKLRAAYGRGVRAARSAGRPMAWRGAGYGALAGDLSSERQSGIESGIDVAVGGALVLHLTRFDQLASGLIQQVAISSPGMGTDSMGGPRGPRRLEYALQNVGEIANRGWEAEGSVRAGRLVVSGTISLVSSRVQRLATRYTGDLRVGDPMLEVPARTLGLAAAWRARDWSATLGAARAEDWVNYDRAALAQAYARDDRARPALVGSELRTYWREYPGVTHLRASVTRDFRGLSAVLTGDNLLDRQRGEPDNVTVLPGRTITAGLRARF